MYGRLDRVNQWLECLGSAQRSELMRQRLAGGLPVAPLDAFASKHNAELLIPFAPSIQELVEAVH